MKQYLKKSIKSVETIALLIWGLERGGMERVAVNLSELFIKNGYKVIFFVNSNNKKKSYTHRCRVISIYSYIDTTDISKEINSYVCDAYNLKKLKDKYNVDCTISFAPEMNLLNMLSGNGDKKILTIHNCTSLRGDVHSIAYKKPFMHFGNYSTKIVTVCEWCKDDLINKFGIYPSKIQTIYNQASRIKENEFCWRRNLILSVGRLENVKRQWHVLKAFKSIENELPDYKLCFAGDGECEGRLKELTYKLEIADRVEYIGFVNDMQTLYSEAKLLVSTSKSEAFPCVAVEAMSYGIPIVAFDVPGGLPEAMGVNRKTSKYPMDAEAGIITEYCDDDSDWDNTEINEQEIKLGLAMLKLLTDEKLYDEKVAGTKKMCEIFDEKVIGEQWINLLEE